MFDKENFGGSFDSGCFLVDCKGVELKFGMDVDEMDVIGRLYNFGFSDLDEEGVRKCLLLEFFLEFFLLDI